MGDRELIQVAAFKLHESAERLHAQAGAARSATLRRRLAALAALLAEQAVGLHALRGNGNGGAPVLRVSSEPAELLRRVYQLTRAEARIALCIAGGESVADIAAASGVAPQTVRNQLKVVFAKTGTTRQAQLVRLVLTGGGASSLGHVGPASVGHGLHAAVKGVARRSVRRPDNSSPRSPFGS